MMTPNTIVMRLIICVLLIAALWGCEDVIEVDLNQTDPQLVIEAWVDNRNAEQTITLSWSQPYFDATNPTGISTAQISLTRDDGQIFNFTHDTNGQYVWTPTGAETLGEVGHVFTLDVSMDGERYTSTSEINRVPGIDSISQELRVDELFFPDGIYAQLYVRDFPGVGDTYYARTYKNGVFLNKPAEMLISYDGSFNAGSGLDGLVFIRPIREFINPIADDSGDEETPPPYQVGDEIFVELFSISNEAFFFLQLAQEQLLNGDNGIFTVPLANTTGNVLDASTQKPILGFFNIGAVSTLNKQIE